MVPSQSNLFCRSSTKSANLELVTCTCTLVSCWFSSDSYNHSKTGGFMRVHVGTWILSLALLFSLGCNKPSQSNNSQNPDNSQANNSSPAATQDNSQPAPPPTSVTVPAGKVLTIQLADGVGSKISQPGQNFSGSLSRAVLVNGQEVIPAGSRVAVRRPIRPGSTKTGIRLGVTQVDLG